MNMSFQYAYKTSYSRPFGALVISMDLSGSSRKTQFKGKYTDYPNLTSSNKSKPS
jgi:hemolysin activation/secretion protein